MRELPKGFASHLGGLRIAMLDRVHEIAKLLLAGAVEEAIWREGLAQLGDWLGARHLLVHSPRGERPEAPWLCWAAGIPSGLGSRLAAYAGVIASLAHRLPPGRAARREELIPEAVLRRSPLWKDVVRPLGGYRTALGAPFSGAMLIACREPGAPAFSARDLAALEQTLPALAQALRLKRQVQAVETQASGLAEVCEEMETGIALLDAAGRKLYANRAALQMLVAEGNPSGQTGQRGDLQWRAAAQAAACASIGRLDRKGHPPLLVRAVRLAGGQRGDAAASTALLLHDPWRPRPAAALVAAGTLGLTPRECEICGLLASGHGTREIAAALGISVGNLRVHFKHIFAKTGARGRIALVALLRPAG